MDILLFIIGFMGIVLTYLIIAWANYYWKHILNGGKAFFIITGLISLGIAIFSIVMGFISESKL